MAGGTDNMPKQRIGGCGFHCVLNCCELLLFSMVSSQDERASDDHLRLEIVQSLERAIVNDKTVTETELTRVDGCKTNAINIDMNDSFENESDTGMNTEDMTSISRCIAVDNSESIIINITAIYLRVMRYSSNHEYTRATNTSRRIHFNVWPDYCTAFDINLNDVVEITVRK
jgi:hypothetical protein